MLYESTPIHAIPRLLSNLPTIEAPLRVHQSRNIEIANPFSVDPRVRSKRFPYRVDKALQRRITAGGRIQIRVQAR